ncbi:MAG: hypothetical protein ACLRNA_09405 [Gemmiger formicilis]|uniref:hypothetical protein n=1 Tax=Gemmiger formicilis TaxID=745368 RepID=UPI003A157685
MRPAASIWAAPGGRGLLLAGLRVEREVCADGWDNWRDPENEKTARFGEHGSTGPGSAAKRAFGSVDDDNEANAQREMYARVKAEFGVE